MWAASMLLWALGPSSTAEEPTPPSVVQWTTSPGCPEGAVVRERVSELLAPGPRPPTWRARGTIEQGADGYVLQLDIDVGAGREHRELRANDCALLTHAASLVIAVTVDAMATSATLDALRRTPAAPVSDPAKPRPPIVAPLLPPAPSPEESATTTPPHLPPNPPTDPTPPVGVSVGLLGGISAGITPGISGGLEGSLGVHVGRTRIVLAGYHWFASRVDLDGQTNAGIRSAASGGSLRGCHALSQGRVDIPLCGGIDLATIQGRGRGTNVNPQNFRGLWVGAVASTGLQLRLTRRFALAARVDGIAALRRPAAFLMIEGQPQVVFRSAPVGVRVVTGPIFSLR